MRPLFRRVPTFAISATGHARSTVSFAASRGATPKGGACTGCSPIGSSSSADTRRSGSRGCPIIPPSVSVAQRDSSKTGLASHTFFSSFRKPSPRFSREESAGPSCDCWFRFLLPPMRRGGSTSPRMSMCGRCRRSLATRARRHGSNAALGALPLPARCSKTSRKTKSGSSCASNATARPG